MIYFSAGLLNQNLSYHQILIIIHIISQQDKLTIVLHTLACQEQWPKLDLNNNYLPQTDCQSAIRLLPLEKI